MKKQYGSQTREPIEDTEYQLEHIDEEIIVGVEGHHISVWPIRREAVLIATDTGKRGLWCECDDDFAGYVVVIDGMGFEFVRSIK